MLALLVTTGLAQAQEAACTQPAPAAALEQRMDAAEAAWVALDIAAFRSAADDLAAAVPCVAQPLDLAQAARVHRLQGMRAFVQSDTPRAELAFAAARRLEPGKPLAEGLAPANHPVRKHFSALPIDDLGEERVTESGRWVVDGRPAESRPTRLPTIVQLLDGSEEAVQRGWYLWPGEAPVLPEAGAGSGRWFALAGGISLLAAGGSYLGAVASESRYSDPATPRSELDGLRARTNGLVWTSASLVGAGLGVGAVAFAVEW